MAAASAIGRSMPMAVRGAEPNAQSHAASPRRRRSARTSPRNCSSTGRRSRSRAGFAASIPEMRVCTSATKRSIARSMCRPGARFKKELLAHLRRHHPLRRSRRYSKAGQPRGQIIDAVPIADCPASVDDRAVPGHWEGDLLAGAKNTHIATLVERQSRFVQLIKVPSKETVSVVRALTRHVRRLPNGLMASLTWDRGLEMAHHKRFSVATDVAVYFCDLQSPWQRGTNENTNGLLRQYFPKGTDLSTVTQTQLNAVARRLNMRPRKTLGFMTPAEKLAETVALTG